MKILILLLGLSSGIAVADLDINYNALIITEDGASVPWIPSSCTGFAQGYVIQNDAAMLSTDHRISPSSMNGNSVQINAAQYTIGNVPLYYRLESDQTGSDCNTADENYYTFSDSIPFKERNVTTGDPLCFDVPTTDTTPPPSQRFVYFDNCQFDIRLPQKMCGNAILSRTGDQVCISNLQPSHDRAALHFVLRLSLCQGNCGDTWQLQTSYILLFPNETISTTSQLSTMTVSTTSQLTTASSLQIHQTLFIAAMALILNRMLVIMCTS